MDRGGERAKSLVRADVRGRLLTADVLFACCQREHEATSAFGIGGLTGKTARHLTNKFIAGRNDAGEWTAVARCKPEALGFHGNDVGLSRWTAASRAKLLL